MTGPVEVAGSHETGNLLKFSQVGVGTERQVSLVSGKPRIEGPQLEGHAPKASLQAFLPTREVTGDRAVAEWVVRAPKGTHLALTARAERAGVVRTEVSLD